MVKDAIDDSDNNDDYEVFEVKGKRRMVMLLGVMIMVKMTKDD